MGDSFEKRQRERRKQQRRQDKALRKRERPPKTEGEDVMSVEEFTAVDDINAPPPEEDEDGEDSKDGN